MLKTALIGYGNWGPNVARNIAANKNLRLHTVCDIKPDRLDAARQVYYGRTEYEPDHRKLLRDTAIDAVAVAVETSGHYRVVREALEAGRHVYVEKPFTATVGQAEELAELAHRNGRIIHVDHLMMYHPAIRMMKDLIDSGDLGDILYIDAMRMNMGTIKRDVDVMWDLSVHDLAVIDYLSGGREPRRVSAFGQASFGITDSLVFLTLDYPGFLASVRSSWISPARERRLTVTGSRKTAVFDELKPSDKLAVYDTCMEVVSGSGPAEADYAVRVRNGAVTLPFIPPHDALFNSIDQFARAVASGTPSMSGPEQAIRIQRIMERCGVGMME